MDDGIDLHTTGLPLCQFTSLDILAYRHNLHAQAQTALSELEAILAEVCDAKSTNNTPTWGERMERQEESWEEFRPKIMDEFLKHSYLSENCVSLSQTIVCPYIHSKFSSLDRCAMFVGLRWLISGVTNVGLVKYCALLVMLTFISKSHFMIGKCGLMDFGSQLPLQLQELELKHPCLLKVYTHHTMWMHKNYCNFPCSSLHTIQYA